MADDVKNMQNIRRVPWFSLDEWHQAYSEIYSNDEEQQQKGYETLLIWKARMGVLPVGVECTLSLLQICLRDREWSPKIHNGDLAISYEYDLCLMYSTTIMRFLNRITNVGQRNINNLFQVAQKLKIPDGIVGLRHEAAHGDNLPSIGLLRTAVNNLLTWLHDEYWTANTEEFEEKIGLSQKSDVDEDQSSNTLINYIEIWLSLGIYREAGFEYISELQDDHLQNILKDLGINNKKQYNENQKGEGTSDDHIPKLQSNLLNLIYKHSEDVNDANDMLNFLIDSDTFLPVPAFIELFQKKSNKKSQETQIYLPRNVIAFWNHFLLIVHERQLLDQLVFKLIEVVNSESECNAKRTYASLWINIIMQGFLKLKFAQKDLLIKTWEFSPNNKKVTLEKMNQFILKKIHKDYPELKHSIWLNIKSNIPSVFLQSKFLTDILTNFNEFTPKFIKPILSLAKESIGSSKIKQLMQLIDIYSGSKRLKSSDTDNESVDVIHTVDELQTSTRRNRKNPKDEKAVNLLDTVERNTKWELASNEFNWNCPIGILPWQNSYQPLTRFDQNKSVKILNTPDVYNTIPGIIQNKKLKLINRANWSGVLTDNSNKRKHTTESDIIMVKAIQSIKSKKLLV